MPEYRKEFLDRISKYGQIYEINDNTLYLIFQPRNGLGAKLTFHGGLVNILMLGIADYNPVTMQALFDGQYWNLSESEANEVLADGFERFES